MTQDIRGGLSAIFSDAFGHDVPVSDATTAADVDGWDSFRQIEILMAAEQRFGIKFTSREIDGLHTVGDLVATIERKVE